MPQAVPQFVLQHSCRVRIILPSAWSNHIVQLHGKFYMDICDTVLVFSAYQKAPLVSSQKQSFGWYILAALPSHTLLFHYSTLAGWKMENFIKIYNFSSNIHLIIIAVINDHFGPGIQHFNLSVGLIASRHQSLGFLRERNSCAEFNEQKICEAKGILSLKRLAHLRPGVDRKSS